MVRQHVNPLSRFYQLPRLLPAPEVLFAEPERPLHLDLGSARGRFLLALAPLQPQRNHLGVEIRRPLVAAAEADRSAMGLTNLAFLFANANISLPAWLEALPPGRLALVSLQFPDPWFKRKHHKRRVLQPALLRALALALAPGRQLFLQSDVAELIEPMLALVDASGCFSRPEPQGSPWLPHNPLALPTERERHVLAQGLPVWRVLFSRNDAAVPALSMLESAAAALEPARPVPESAPAIDAPEVPDGRRPAEEEERMPVAAEVWSPGDRGVKPAHNPVVFSRH